MLGRSGGSEVSVSVRSGSGTRLPNRWAGAPGPGALRAVAVASLLANVGIVLTGGAVRLTGSGLGCPAWPRCTADSYVVHGELGVHGVIEFGNRMLTFAVAAVALVTLVVVWR
ncbi:MAG: COX15/CtaA family protein, partial [Nocardioidaceae bacterium]|nr:COX15/CtaA family protein [Nocardioidaceae bacterium]